MKGGFSKRELYITTRSSIVIGYKDHGIHAHSSSMYMHTLTWLNGSALEYLNCNKYYVSAGYVIWIGVHMLFMSQTAKIIYFLSLLVIHQQLRTPRVRTVNMPTVHLIDYVAGNIRSLVNAIEKVGYTVEWIRSPEDVAKADV